MEDLFVQATKFGTEVWRIDCINVVCYSYMLMFQIINLCFLTIQNFSSRPFQIKTVNATVYAHSVIISTGAEALWLHAEAEESFKGKGISTCATCDGFLFRNKSVVVIGGGDSGNSDEYGYVMNTYIALTILHN